MSIHCQSPNPQGPHHKHPMPPPHIYQPQQSKLDCHLLAPHRHASAQITTIPRQSVTFPYTNGEQVYYGDRTKCLDAERFQHPSIQCRRVAKPPGPIPSQSCPNRVPIRFQLECQYCQSDANQVPIHCQSDADPVLIRCQTKANLMSIECPTDVNPVPIRCQYIANPVPIQCQCIANPVPIDFPIQRRQIANLPIQSQSYANPVPILCRSNAVQQLPIQSGPNPQPIRYQFSANPVPFYQFNANLPIKCQSITDPFQSANPSPIHQYIANFGPICQSITKLSIHHQS